MKLVASYEQALACARDFQKIHKTPDSVAFQQLGRYFHWHYFEELHGFAPSKFVGYMGTTVKNYKSEGMGTETVRALSKIFVQVPRPSQQFDFFAEQLSAWLVGQGSKLSAKTIRGTGGIYVRRDSSHAQESQGKYSAQITSSKTEHFEGNPIEVLQTRYERDPGARTKCIESYEPKYACQVCFTNFEQRYGKVGRDFIHVHHIKPLSSLGSEHKIDPVKDLVPLCPNCHAMIHRLQDPTIEALRELLR